MTYEEEEYLLLMGEPKKKEPEATTEVCYSNDTNYEEDKNWLQSLLEYRFPNWLVWSLWITICLAWLINLF